MLISGIGHLGQPVTVRHWHVRNAALVQENMEKDDERVLEAVAWQDVNWRY